ncbi:MAG: hypothetical protein KatS3mg110_4442 [Pirellulaceae bacterium]|nr:MAG: hypothetical protein KatS3mg110_4442 [Pirellulaceae bacterium]
MLIDRRRLDAILDHWPFVASRANIARVAEGLSGAAVWRVETAHGCWALKRWAPHMPAKRLESIHEALREIFDRGFRNVAVPLVTRDGCTIVVDADARCWELSPWMPGRSLQRNAVGPHQICRAMEKLAEFHRASRQVIGCGPEYGVVFDAPPVLVSRLSQLRQWNEGRLAELERSARGHRVARELDAGRAISHIRRLVQPLVRQGSLHAHRTGPCQLIAGDLWRANVLFDSSGECYFIDFGGMRVDAPEVDVVRLLGSLVVSDDDWRSGLEAYYGRFSSCTAWPNDWLLWLFQSGVVLSVLNWLWRMCTEELEAVSERSLCRIRELIEDLERIAATGGPRIGNVARL